MAHALHPGAPGWKDPAPFAAALRLPFDVLEAAAAAGPASRVHIPLAPGYETRAWSLAPHAESGFVAVLIAGVATLLYRYGAGEEMVADTAWNREADGKPPPRRVRFPIAADDSFRVLAARAEQASRISAPAPAPDADGRTAAQVRVELDARATGPRGGAEEGMTGEIAFLWSLGSDGLQGEIVYRTDLFTRDTAIRLARHLATLLTAAADRPDAPIAELDLLDDAERRLLLRDWAGEPGARPEMDNLPAWFEMRAAETPDAVAVVDGARRITYGELRERGLRLARRLRGIGIRPEDRVAVCIERSLELVVAIVGTLRAGAACVCLDSEDPATRLKIILEDSGARLLLLSGSTGAPIGSGVPVLRTDEAGDGARGEDADGDPTLPEGANLAFVFYTTGSTGRPKGVMITHAARCERLAWELGAYEAALGAGLLLKTPVSFARLVKETFWALLSGGTVVVAPKGAQRDPERIAALVAAHGVGLAIFVPSQIHSLLNSGAMDTAAGGLRLVLAEGEPLPRDLMETWRERVPAALWNAYGLTEVSTVSVWSGGPAGARRLVPSGRPAGVRLYLLDRHMRPVPVGVPGEIYVGGPGVFRGYLGRPAETAARLVPDPFSGAPGARLFRTGDLALWQGDGTLVSLGRNDAQTKLHGYRVEPGEIEAALATHPDVAEAAAMVREDAPGERRLVAYAVRRRGAAVSEGMLRQFLRGLLPAYLVPARCVVLDALPLTPNGKVDRRELPAPAPARPLPEAGYEPPRGAVEQLLADRWERLLNVRRVGALDDFFALGGTSLLAAELVAGLEEELGIHLPLATVLDAPTVERLAAVIRGGGPSDRWSPLVCLADDGDGPPFFCVHGLFGNVLCFRELARRLGPGQPFYALQSQALDPADPPLSRVEEMATRYLYAVRAVQPEGPYLLGGYSFGGMVAFEMAQQLAAAGERVGLLALIDAAAPGVHRGVPPFEHTVYVRAALGAAQEGARWRTLALDRVVDDGVAGFAPSWTLRSHVDDPYGRYRRVEQATRAATRAYHPRPYAGRVDLVRGRDQRSRLSLEPWAGWGPLAAAGLRVHDVPGDHVTMLSHPWVESLAAVLRDLLADAVTPLPPTARH